MVADKTVVGDDDERGGGNEGQGIEDPGPDVPTPQEEDDQADEPGREPDDEGLVGVGPERIIGNVARRPRDRPLAFAEDEGRFLADLLLAQDEVEVVGPDHDVHIVDAQDVIQRDVRGQAGTGPEKEEAVDAQAGEEEPDSQRNREKEPLHSHPEPYWTGIIACPAAVFNPQQPPAVDRTRRLAI
jgi:hypothetical protein